MPHHTNHGSDVPLNEDVQGFALGPNVVLGGAGGAIEQVLTNLTSGGAFDDSVAGAILSDAAIGSVFEKYPRPGR